MSKLVVVFGTSHQLQGAKRFPRSIDDPSYRELLEQLVVGHRIDFIFEEASGLGPTDAERLASSLASPIRYLDVEPHRGERHKYGLSTDTGMIHPIDPYSAAQPPDVAHWEYAEQHMKREEFWLQRIREQHFDHGLMICGYFHVQSLASRFIAAGFDVKSLYYMPHHKLCTKPHAGAI